MDKRILTAEYLLSRIHYDQKTGIFTHKHGFGSRFKIGDRADKEGHARLTGYRLINLLNQKFLAHRVAWMYVHGSFPDLYVDHMNGDKSDNRIENLRLVTSQVNIQNQRVPTKRNKTGALGVYRHKNKFRVRLTVNNKSIHIGMFDTVDEAYQAYVNAKRVHHEGCTL